MSCYMEHEYWWNTSYEKSCWEHSWAGRASKTRGEKRHFSERRTLTLSIVLRGSIWVENSWTYCVYVVAVICFSLLTYIYIYIYIYIYHICIYVYIYIIYIYLSYINHIYISYIYIYIYIYIYFKKFNAQSYSVHSRFLKKPKLNR